MEIVKITKENHQKLKQLKDQYKAPIWKIADSILEDGLKRLESGKSTVKGVSIKEVS